MKTRFAIALLLILMTAGMGHGQRSDESKLLRLAGNGVWWDSLSADRKADFVDGFSTAMERANGMTHGECMSKKNEVKPGPSFDAQFNEVMNLCLLADLFDYSVGVQKLSDGVDQFYKDSGNIRIPIDFAMQHVRDQLKGKRAPKEMEDELTDWRRITNK